MRYLGPVRPPHLQIHAGNKYINTERRLDLALLLWKPTGPSHMNSPTHSFRPGKLQVAPIFTGGFLLLVPLTRQLMSWRNAAWPLPRVFAVGTLHHENLALPLLASVSSSCLCESNSSLKHAVRLPLRQRLP